MKRIILLVGLALLLIAVLMSLAACGYGGYSEEDCELNWQAMDVDYGDEALTVNLILNNTHAPGTVGEVLYECIMGGWEGYR